MRKRRSRPTASLLLIIILYSLLTSCHKDPVFVHQVLVLRDKSAHQKGDSTNGPVPTDTVVPSITDVVVLNITSSGATVTGVASANGGSVISEKGICYGTHANVSLNDSVMNTLNTTDSFSVSINNLVPNTTYYVKAYAKNGTKTGYSSEVQFTTIDDPSDSFHLSGIWRGSYFELTTFDGVGWLVQLNVSASGNNFTGVVRPVYDTILPVRHLKGTISADGTQLTLDPDGPVQFANPWIINGNTIDGYLKPDTAGGMIENYHYQFTKQ